MNRFKPVKYVRQRYNESSKTWSFQVFIRPEGGDPITKTFTEREYGSARRAYDSAVLFANQKAVDIHRGILEKKTSITLEEVFYETFTMFPVREETKRKHISMFNRFIKMDMRIKDIKRSHVISSLNAMVRNSTDDTIVRVLTIWRRIFKTAIAKEYILIDHTIGVSAPKSQVIPKEKRKVVTDRDTLDVLISKVKSTFRFDEADAVCTALEVMYYTGMRPAECFALSPRDIHTSVVGGIANYISINKELGSGVADGSNEVDEMNRLVVRRCKTEASVRDVPIPTKLAKILKEYDGSYEDILFPTRFGDYFNLTILSSRLHRLVPDFNMYQLRHTVATKLVTSGVDQRTIVEILGHENFNMSVYYARSNQGLKLDALDLIH